MVISNLGVRHYLTTFPAISRELRAKTHSRDLEEGTESETLEEHCLVASFLDFLGIFSYTIQDHQPGMAPLTMGLTCQNQLLIKI